MQKFTLFLVLILLSFSLAACGGRAGGGLPRYEAPAKPGGRMCANQCRSANDHCADSCQLQERVCVNEKQTQAIKDYEDYTRAQFIARAPVELRPRDFEKLESCVSTNCRSACTKVYDSCFVNCGGKIVGDSIVPFSLF